jgi:hypothetical protein
MKEKDNSLYYIGGLAASVWLYNLYTHLDYIPYKSKKEKYKYDLY